MARSRADLLNDRARKHDDVAGVRETALKDRLDGVPLLLSKYMTTCRRWPGNDLSCAPSVATTGTVGPTAIGTVPTGLPRTLCSVTLV
jgi:hypothetical protein